MTPRKPRRVSERRNFVRRANGHAKHLAPAIGIDGNGYYYGDRHDAAGLTHLDVGGVDPQVRPRAFDGPLKEGVDALVDIGAQP